MGDAQIAWPISLRPDDAFVLAGDLGGGLGAAASGPTSWTQLGLVQRLLLQQPPGRALERCRAARAGCRRVRSKARVDDARAPPSSMAARRLLAVVALARRRRHVGSG